MAAMDLPGSHDDDDLLDHPTRRRLFAALGKLGGPAGTDDLAARLGLHPNGVRVHLGRMLDAGLVVRRRVAGARGRPRDQWAVAAGAEPGGDPPHAYGALAGWLALAIPATPERLDEIEATGRAIGREIATTEPFEPERAVGDLLSSLGFQPQLERTAEGRLSCRLGNCPYRDSVRQNRDVVCTLHRGMTRGLLDRVAPTATLARFVPHDPDRAGCEIDIDGLTAAPS
jgi:predicted ArsR family transcriptional regulator